MPSPALVDKLYISVCVGCDYSACTALFVAKIESDEPLDPVDAWAVRAAEEAEQLGWSISEDCNVFCPSHSTGAAGGRG
jgi:hypothetical protein